MVPEETLKVIAVAVVIAVVVAVVAGALKSVRDTTVSQIKAYDRESNQFLKDNVH